MAEMTQEQIDTTALYLNDDNLALVQKFIDTHTNWPMTSKDIFNAIKKNNEFLNDITEASFASALSCNVRSGYIVGIVGRKRIGYVLTARAEPTKRPPAREKRKRGRPPSNPSNQPVEAPQPIVKTAAKKSVPAVPGGQSPVPTAPPEPKIEFAQPAPIPLPLSSVSTQGRAASGLGEPPFRYKYARCIWIGRKLFLVPRSNSMIEPLLNVVSAKPDKDGQLVVGGRQYHCDHLEIVEKFLKAYFYAVEKGEYDPVLAEENGLAIEMRISAGETHIPANIFT